MDLAMLLRENKYTLRSGGAKGADQAFAYGAGKDCQIIRPNDEIPTWAFQTVEKFHPAPDRLSPYTTRCHARNAMIILGENKNKPVDFVLCWTPAGKLRGGTSQGIRIAQAYGIDVYNLGDENNSDVFALVRSFPESMMQLKTITTVTSFLTPVVIQ